MTARQRATTAVMTNFEEHVRATAEMLGLVIAHASTVSQRGAEIQTQIDMCSRIYQRLVIDEAGRRLGISVGRRGRRKIQEAVR